MRNILFLLLSLCSVACNQPHAIKLPVPSQVRLIGWDIEKLMVPPEYRWVEKEDSIRSLLFRGEDYMGQATEIFAYYGSPATIDPRRNNEPFPAIVLVHGGGGTAFKWWVRSWVEKGYAAIAIDFGGNMPVDDERRPETVHLPNGGPAHSNEAAFHQIDSLIQDQWQYHAVAAIIRSHSLLRSFEEADAERTAITGVSWGGYLTCIVSGIDSRFSASVPVYGSGFLSVGSYWTMKGVFDKMTEDQIARWNLLWDPAEYVPFAKMPMLFINGTNDRFYYLEGFNKTAMLAPNTKILAEVDLKHSHYHGTAIDEIHAFLEHHLNGAAPLPAIADIKTIADTAVAEYSSQYPLKSSHFIYTSDTTGNENRCWLVKDALLQNNQLISHIPKDTRAWFFQITDSRDFKVSSSINFNK